MIVVTKFLFIFILLIATVKFIFSARRHIIKMILFILFFLGCFLIIQPEFATSIANFFGIGRGVDLIIYLSIFYFFIVSGILYFKYLQLSEKITIIIRRDAVSTIFYTGKGEEL